MKQMIILRGIPGSGKSTLANVLYNTIDDCRIINADTLLIDENGEYKWSPDAMRNAHGACKIIAEMAMVNGAKCIINDNTNTKESDYKPYMELAEKYGYQVHVIHVENHHGSKSSHDIPEKTMNKMKARLGIKK
jgi:predicted kinase